MKFPTYSIKYKFDYFFVIIVVLIAVSGLYVNQNRKDFISITDRIVNSEKINGTLYNISQKISNDEKEIQKYFSNGILKPGDESKSHPNILSELDALTSLFVQNQIVSSDLDSLSKNIKEYYKLREGKFLSISSSLNNKASLKQAKLFTAIIQNLDELKKKSDLTFRMEIQNLELTKLESYSASVFIILLIMLILTALYLKFRRDIGIREKTEKQLVEKSLELDLINQNKEKLFRVIAHDLRSPFHPILTIAEILKMVENPVDKAEINNLGEKLHIVGEGALNLLDNLLAWSRVQTGSISLNSELFPLKEKIDTVLENLKMLSDKKEITVVNEVRDNFWIISDHNIMLSLIQNLVSNAIKFTKPHGLVTINAKAEKENILISVSDNGIGISKENLERIFDQSTLHSTMGTNSERGSGLGLLLCKEYVELHQGKIWAESELGRGSTFYFTIPVKIICKDEQTYYYKAKSISYSNRKSKDLVSISI